MPDSHHSRISALFTDLYELTMLGAYHAEGRADTAVFELFFRELPAHRNYVIAAGQGEVLDYLQNLHFTPSDIEWLAGLGKLDRAFLDSLESFRFSGEVYAVPEGTVVFPNEPVLQIVAPLPEAQLVETFVLNQMHVQSLAATKAARLAHAAGKRTVADFGSRRAHGTDAALKTARAGFIGGISGTSNLLAARCYGVPALGTMAHSYIQTHDDESSAFEAFAGVYPDTTLLVDTYDTLAGVRRVAELARRPAGGVGVGAVRLDSGDLENLIPQARAILDDAGLTEIKIIASGGLDEHRIRDMVAAGVPVDGFGVGTELAVSGDAPHLDLSYKLVEYAGEPRMKLSTGKVSLPGRKQVYRRRGAAGITGDCVARWGESLVGDALLVKMMEQGDRTGDGRWTLGQAREHCRRERHALPPVLHTLDQVPADEAYPVSVSDELRRARDGLIRRLTNPA